MHPCPTWHHKSITFVTGAGGKGLHVAAADGLMARTAVGSHGGTMRTQRINDVTAIRDEVEIPGLGALPINAFVLHAQQPVLVDTGRPVARQAFLENLGS